MTWVLFVIVFSVKTHEPAGVTSVPGYTLQDCQKARREVEIAQGPAIGVDQAFAAQTFCIPGPGR